MLRRNNIRKLSEGTFDVLVIGGGINGVVSAAALSARGARVGLIDRGDFAGATSEQTSNLAWGGIKYLESYEFGLVRKLCQARNKLIRSYPSTVQEIRFYTVHEKSYRHGLWKLYAGAWFYWLIGDGFTSPPRLLSRRTIASEEPTARLDGCDGGLEYSDAYFHDNDARFTFGFARSAINYGCAAANYVEAVDATLASGGPDAAGRLWSVRARDVESGATFDIRARTLVNACGPYADAFNRRLGQTTRHRHVFSKGIHLLVNRLTPDGRVLTFFADDGRLFFAIPMGPRTCVGTTDERVPTPEVAVTSEDRRFVLDNVNRRLKLPTPLTEADIIAERCGVRPLVVSGSDDGDQDWTHLSRRHVIESDRDRSIMSIFGGKLTDCLNVGDEICETIKELGIALPYPAASWYGEPPATIRDEFFHQARLMDLDSLTSPHSSEKRSTRLWRRYGTRALGMLEEIRADPRMAELLIQGAEYIRCELEQAARHEMVVRLEDFLRRRSKIALVMSRDRLRQAPGLFEACEILFGDRAQSKLDEYFAAAGAQEEASFSGPSPD